MRGAGERACALRVRAGEDVGREGGGRGREEWECECECEGFDGVGSRAKAGGRSHFGQAVGPLWAARAV